MISTYILFKSVFLMFLLLIPGYIMRKTKLATNTLARDFANTILYITQPALIISAFIRPFDKDVLVTAAGVFIYSFMAHFLFYFVSLYCFKKVQDKTRRVLRFGIIFSNAGFMGLPLIVSLLGNETAIYVSIYLISFNVFTWSVGCLIYTGDKSYISAKKMLTNPAIISIIIGLIIFLLPVDGYIPEVLTNALDAIKDTVAPMSMMMVGMRLADVKWKGMFKDKNMLYALSLRLLLLPAGVWAIIKLVSLSGIYNDPLATAVILLCSSTPVGTVTSMFAEKFDGDTLYASKMVSLSTILSLATMPIVALLLMI